MNKLDNIKRCHVYRLNSTIFSVQSLTAVDLKRHNIFEQNRGANSLT